MPKSGSQQVSEREESKTYAAVSSEYVRFKCRSVDNHTFILQRVSEYTGSFCRTVAPTNSFCIPYNTVNLENLEFTPSKENNSVSFICWLCDRTATDTSYNQQNGQSAFLCKSCVEMYNKTLQKFIEEVEEHKSEIIRNEVAEKI